MVHARRQEITWLALAAQFAFLALPGLASPGEGNRLTYLDGSDPYYVNLKFAKLTTPQWVGEEGVKAVVVLAIDDMGDDHQLYERYLRPILDRLKKIDGRAAVSIMTNHIAPDLPHLQAWLKEGVSLEAHTYDHPCPILKNRDFNKAKATYDKCVDSLGSIPSSQPVAFRVPCCDWHNTVSPRFYAEIFNRVTSKGNFLEIDTSIVNIMTGADPDLPPELVKDPELKDRFMKFMPSGQSFVNTIQNYPYPFVIGRLCWEFPCVMPSDFTASYLHKSDNPITVRDWKAAIDATVIKEGTFTLIFHPHGWIKGNQVNELIDHAVSEHGRKVKFLTFREIKARLDQNLLDGHALRAKDGSDNGVRLIDLNNDSYMDVVIANHKTRQTRVWSPEKGRWITGSFPLERLDVGARFGVMRPDGHGTVLSSKGAWHFDGADWVKDEAMGSGTDLDERLDGVRLRDIDADGICELIVNQAVYRWSGEGWQRLPFSLPAPIVDAEGFDRGLRFVDLHDDGQDDIVYSNDDGWGVYVFASMEEGWTRVSEGKPGEEGALPLIVRGQTNNGAWFHSRHLWVQNEDTAQMENMVDRRSFKELLKRR